MFKSIFSKYFAVISSIIVVSFLVLQGMQLFLSAQYWLNEKHDMLHENAVTIAAHTAENTIPVVNENGIGYRMQKANLSPFIRLLSNTLDSTVVIVNMDGELLVVCDDQGNEVAGHGSIVLKDIVKYQGKEYYAVSTLGGLYDEQQYTAGVPISKDGNLLGYVFISTPAAGFGQNLRTNIQIALVATLGVLALTFIALYIMTARLVKPLREMAKATRSFAQGDFSYRLKVSGKDETAELALALNSMATSLSSVEDMRRSFIANVSHELRTPMTTIAGFIDGILDGTIPANKREYYLRIVTDEVKRLSRLVKSMLALSRIDNGDMKLNMTDFELTALIGQTLLSFEKRIEDKHICVDGLEDVSPLTVHGDFDLLGQVLYNLMDNAVKFTNDGGTITLTVMQVDGRTVFAIRNTGDGIPSEEMPRIFERFYKSDRSRGLDKNGVGLGLYIVQTVIALHGGEVRVRSTAGEYTEFLFWLPHVKK